MTRLLRRQRVGHFGRRRIGQILLALAAAAPATAQSVTVVATRGESAEPIAGAIVYLIESDTVRESALTDQRGRVAFRELPEGSYRVRVDMMGMESVDAGLGELRGASNVTHNARMTARPIALDGVQVRLARDRCDVRPSNDGELVARLWDEASKALAAASLTAEEGRYYYETVWYERHVERGSGVVRNERREPRNGYMAVPYESRPASDLAANGFVQEDDGEELFFAPDASALLSDHFLDRHCFHLVTPRPEAPDLIGLGFRPLGDRRSVPDIAGTMWLSLETAELASLDFVYQYLEPERTGPDVGGSVTFERLPAGSWIVREWWIQMPVMARQIDFAGRAFRSIHSYRRTGGLVTGLREAPQLRPLFKRASVGIAGRVVDSLGMSARGVGVSVVGSNQVIYTNADGEFGMTGLVEGRYPIRIVDPRLSDVGYEAEAMVVEVAPGAPAYLEHQLPSLSDVLIDRCGGLESDDSGVVAGRVVDAAGDGVRDAVVKVVWMAYDFSGIHRGRTARDIRELPQTLEVETREQGAFTLCNVPRRTPLLLHAERGESMSDGVEVLLHEIQPAAARTLVLPASRQDIPPPPRRLPQ